jgi:hypothetical protein
METMKKQTRLPIALTLAALLFTLLSISSCSTKKQGCTNTDAINYDVTAEEDDGSCTYAADVVFWISEATSDTYLANSVNTLSVYIDGALIGTLTTINYSSSAPACNSGEGLSSEVSLGSDASKQFNLEVKDESDNLLHNATITVEARDCKTVEIP